MKSLVLTSSDKYRVEYFYEDTTRQRKLAYIFTGLGHRELDRKYHYQYGADNFIKNGFDIITFKTNADDWYQSLPEQLFFNIKKWVLDLGQYNRRVAYGFSMGGFASICFSRLLEVDTVIAVSPQYSVNEDYDRRWAKFVKSVDFKYQITRNSLNENCDYFIFYDDKTPDKLHAHKLRDLIPKHQIHLCPISYSGHPCIQYLHEIGVLKDLVFNLANKNYLGEIDLRRNRGRSIAYFCAISEVLVSKGKFQTALSMVNSALRLGGRGANIHRLKSNILQSMGRLDLAILSARDAVSVNQDRLSHQLHLSHILFQSGTYDEALQIINTVLELGDIEAYMYRHKSNILQAMGNIEEAIISARQAIDADKANADNQRHLLYLESQLSS